jgi:hypothetical protein
VYLRTIPSTTSDTGPAIGTTSLVGYIPYARHVERERHGVTRSFLVVIVSLWEVKCVPDKGRMKRASESFIEIC